MTEGNKPNSLGMSEFDVRLREEIEERHEFVTELMKELENPLKGLELLKKKCTASNRKNNSSNTLREIHGQLQRLLIGTVSESTESTENVNKSLQRKTDDLKQPPQNDQESNQNGPCNIKQEKQSISSCDEENKENAIKVKSEPNNEMPQPPVPRTARRKTKKALKPEPSERTTRSRARRIAKKTNSSEQASSDEESNIKNSDVIVKSTNVSIIEITDDESPVKNGRRTKIAEQSLPRSTRARTAKNKKDLAQESTKRSRSLEEKSDTDDQKNNKSAKKSKYQKDNQQAEAEALQKKEAAEEKKRIREERQQKAQLNREIKEKDKQKQLEDAECAIELKMKQILAEREEKLAKQRAEADRKRMLAKMKAQEEKHKEQNRALDGKTKKALPIYMTEKTPLLPTTDCYDSDNENETEYLPDWARKDALLKMDRQILAISHQIKNAFFFVEPKTVDLTEIFPSIKPHKLRRNSSAVWTKPPRYTQESDADDSN